MALDEYMQRLYAEHNLTPDADPEIIEKVVTLLLGHPDTTLSAIQLGLGRRVDARELKDNGIDLMGFIANPQIEAQERYAYLLMQKSMELPQESK